MVNHLDWTARSADPGSMAGTAAADGNLIHRHTHGGQVLEHAHDGGEVAHGYFEHPEDGSLFIARGSTHTHDYEGHQITHSHDSDHFTRGSREDGSLPDHDPVADHLLAANLTVYRDAGGRVWLEVGPDQFGCLEGQLLRAIMGKWHLVDRAHAEAAAGHLRELGEQE